MSGVKDKEFVEMTEDAMETWKVVITFERG